MRLRWGFASPSAEGAHHYWPADSVETFAAANRAFRLHVELSAGSLAVGAGERPPVQRPSQGPERRGSASLSQSVALRLHVHYLLGS